MTKPVPPEPAAEAFWERFCRERGVNRSARMGRAFGEDLPVVLERCELVWGA